MLDQTECKSTSIYISNAQRMSSSGYISNQWSDQEHGWQLSESNAKFFIFFDTEDGQYVAKAQMHETDCDNEETTIKN